MDRPDNQIVKMDNQTPTVQNERNNFMLAALEKVQDASQLEKLMELQERFEANEAKKAYDKAMAEFKANPPKIMKDKKVSFNSTNYKHATLANVTHAVNTALAQHGLSASWRTNHQDRQVCVTCVVSHAMGHREETTMCAMPDDSGKKNAIQQIGSTVTYLQRYSLLAMVGLAAFDDDDGIASERITEEQVEFLSNKINEHIDDHERFLSWVGVDSVESMTPQKYQTAKKAIEDIIKHQGA